MTDKYPKKLYIPNPEIIGMCEAENGKFYMAHSDPGFFLGMGESDIFGVYVFKGTVKAVNKTEIEGELK